MLRWLHWRASRDIRALAKGLAERPHADWQFSHRYCDLLMYCVPLDVRIEWDTLSDHCFVSIQRGTMDKIDLRGSDASCILAATRYVRRIEQSRREALRKAAIAETASCVVINRPSDPVGDGGSDV